MNDCHLELFIRKALSHLLSLFVTVYYSELEN